MNKQTRKDQVTKTITNSIELTECVGQFTNKRVLKKWMEDFVDEDSGEVVSIERKEVLYDRGIKITSDLASEMLFYIQAGDITEIEVSNQCRAAYEVSHGVRVYLATVEMGLKSKKSKFMFTAVSIPMVVETLKDYIELNFHSPYRLVTIREYNTDIIIYDNLSDGDKSKNEDDVDDDKYYHVTVKVIKEDGFEHSANAVVKTIDLEKAVILLEHRIKQANTDEDFTIKLDEAKIIRVDHFIDDEFTAAYMDEFKQV